MNSLNQIPSLIPWLNINVSSQSKLEGDSILLAKASSNINSELLSSPNHELSSNSPSTVSGDLESGNLIFHESHFSSTSELKASGSESSTYNHIYDRLADLGFENDCLKIYIRRLVKQLDAAEKKAADSSKELSDSKAVIATMEVTINNLNKELALLKGQALDAAVDEAPTSFNETGPHDNQLFEALNHLFQGDTASSPDKMLAKVKELIDENKKLSEKTNEPPANSDNSHLPPSKSLGKKSKKKDENQTGGKRPRGAPLGHPGNHHKKYFSDSEANTVITVPETLPEQISCPRCKKGVLELYPRFDKRHFQFDIDDKIALIKRLIRVRAFKCPICGKVHYFQVPGKMKTTGMIGPKLAALLVYLKVRCHASMNGLKNFVKDLLDLDVSKGLINNTLKKAVICLEEPVNELKAALKQTGFVNADETGHPEYSKRGWTWVFRALTFVLYRISDRSSDNLKEMLGDDYKGVLGCDFFTGYRKYKRLVDCIVQFCFAHLQREVKRLADNLDPEVSAYGQRMLEIIYMMFSVWHKYQDTEDPSYLVELLNIFEKLSNAAKNPPNQKKCKNIAKRFEEYGYCYKTFIYYPEIGPTNNAAERALRPIVIDRYITRNSQFFFYLPFIYSSRKALC